MKGILGKLHKTIFKFCHSKKFNFSIAERYLDFAVDIGNNGSFYLVKLSYKALLQIQIISKFL